MNLRNELKKNKYVYSVALMVYKIFYERILLIISYIGTLFREIGISRNDKYSKLKKYKNIHNGKRCFIVATGPSLTISDLEKLNSEITFGMNTICLLFNQTLWRPTYYGVQDVHVFQKFSKAIIQYDNDITIFAGNSINRRFIPYHWNIYPLNFMGHRYSYNTIKTDFSNDIYKIVYDGFTVTYSLIQIAVYMGFKEIYLLGTDCNYAKGKKNHFDSIDYELLESSVDKANERMIYAYKIAKNFADSNGIKIYNATRGGNLEVFQRVNLDKILGVKGNNENN